MPQGPQGHVFSQLEHRHLLTFFRCGLSFIWILNASEDAIIETALNLSCYFVVEFNNPE